MERSGTRLTPTIRPASPSTSPERPAASLETTTLGRARSAGSRRQVARRVDAAADRSARRGGRMFVQAKGVTLRGNERLTSSRIMVQTRSLDLQNRLILRGCGAFVDNLWITDGAAKFAARRASPIA